MIVKPTSSRARQRPSFPRPPRRWSLELEIALGDVDPERLLRESQGFLVDDTSGNAIGVVEGIEIEGATGSVIGLLVAEGWFGRRRARVDVSAIESLLPDERRIIVGHVGSRAR